jgi:uncharacterized protein (TIGR02271 family)
MLTQDQLQNVIATTAYDRDGDKIGTVGQVYYDDDTDQPKWVTVNTGLFGLRETFVPIQGAQLGDDRVTLAYDKAKVKDAPHIGQDGHLSTQEEERLYRYYGLDYAGAGTGNAGITGDETAGRHALRDTATGTGLPRDLDRDGAYDNVAGGAVGQDTSGPTTDHAMTRSEEELRVGTETREAGRARLRKHVVTEHQRVTVPVSREEVRVEREPITDANRGAAYDGPAISEEEHEVTLRRERPVVETEAVPVERVTVTEQQTVGGEVRKEQIDVDDAQTRRR